jgi:RHS repeat-associated protein
MSRRSGPDTQPASGQDYTMEIENWEWLDIADGSAEEHQAINRYYKQTNAVSTIKLLQLAQSTGAGIVPLTEYNYVSEGTTNFQGKPLENWDPNLWQAVTSAFQDSASAGYVAAYITPGPMTNALYKGMGAMILSPYLYEALITPSTLNGAFAGTLLNPGSVSAANSSAYNVTADNNDFEASLTQPTSGNATTDPAETTLFNVPQEASFLTSGLFVANPTQQSADASFANLFGLPTGTTGADLGADSQNAAQNGNQGTPGFWATLYNSIADPVFPMTGEFHDDETDLQLPGPIPLALRRNYSSQNLADNQFGYGWKLSIMPYLSISKNATNIYAADMDGSVLDYVHQAPTAITSISVNASGSHYLVGDVLDISGGTFTAQAQIQVTATNSYDAAGEITNRVWLNPSGTVEKTQTLSWDAHGRLHAVSQRDAGNSGYNWTTVYDPLNRRISTATVLVTNGVAYPSSVQTINSYFDPQVEFLELGVSYGIHTEWKLYGPDLSGQYGGMNGVGGLDGISPGLSLFNPTVSDVRGNILSYYDSSVGSVTWSPARSTGYGAVPGYRPVALASGATLEQSSVWRGRWPDITGYYNIGLRPYDPISGRWLTYDSSWNGKDPNYYSFCGGDPINGFDSDGRCSLDENSSQGGGPYLLPYLSNPDWALRYESPGNVSTVFQQGYPANGNLSPSHVAFNSSAAQDEASLYDETLGLSGRSWYPASTLSGGATTPHGSFNGTPLYIDLNQAGNVATSDQIIADAQQSGVSSSQIGAYQNNAPNEGEVLVGNVPPGAVVSQSAYVANGVAQAGTAIGVALSAGRLIQAGEQSYQTGDPTYIVNQGVRETGGWAGAYAGAQSTAAIIAAGGWETGPAYPFLIIGGSIVGGTAGYFGGNALTQPLPPGFQPVQLPYSQQVGGVSPTVFPYQQSLYNMANQPHH